MEELNSILKAILEVYNNHIDNDVRHNQSSKLWTSYYKLSDKLGISSDQCYYTYLMLESESYKINQQPVRSNIDFTELETSVHNMKTGDCDQVGITEAEAKLLLDWTVENTRKNLESLCLSVDKSSLNGFCDIGQISSLIALEKLGVEVTKNSATEVFGYPFNHYFGTATFPIITKQGLMRKSYLIDVTFRQFFSSVRCNYGRYFTVEENTGIPTAPDPGFFIEDEHFARELMGVGHVELTDENAKKYGESFIKSACPYQNLDTFVIPNIDYKAAFFERQDTEYAYQGSDLDSFNLDVVQYSHNR